MVAQKSRKAGTNIERSASKKIQGEPSVNKNKTPRDGSDQVDDLLASVRALGGNDEDYALLKDLESDDMLEFSDHEAEVNNPEGIVPFSSLTALLGKDYEGYYCIPQKARFQQARTEGCC